MAELKIETSEATEIIDISKQINAAIPASFSNGICHLFCPHTSAAITVTEKMDPDVKHDILAKLDKLIPNRESYYLHDGGNSAAHIKAMLVGSSLSIPIKNGNLDLGPWQGVCLCEFDGPRARKVKVICQKLEE
ncbi:MAG: YjbQ family protein [Lentisphaerae bacterium]|jgi:secondary thiamine-phosphate synthase enzyme|nr:YjbQ family protein [Lentisphaerota bacterium]